MKFLILFAATVFVLYKAGKFLGGKFEHFLSTSHSRRRGWEWTKRLLFAVMSLLLLSGTFKRWYYFHDEMIYSGDPKQLNLAYANQVDVEAYLMSLQNVIDLFEGSPPRPDQRTINSEKPFYETYPHQPSDPRFYLVIRIKNRGPEITWGVLEYFFDGQQIRQIDIPPLSPEMKEFKNIVLQADFIYGPVQPRPGTYGPYPRLETKWRQLYTAERGKL